MGAFRIVVYGIAGLKGFHLLSDLGLDFSLENKNEFLAIMARDVFDLDGKEGDEEWFQ